MNRIKLGMTTAEALIVMVEGNPGALNVCGSILREGQDIDPDAFFGGWGGLLSLDTCGIYGSRIWMLYKDVCGQSISKVVGLLRACQLGIIDMYQLNKAVDNHGDGVDVEATLAEVRKQLPNFKG